MATLKAIKVLNPVMEISLLCNFQRLFYLIKTRVLRCKVLFLRGVGGEGNDIASQRAYFYFVPSGLRFLIALTPSIVK